MKRVISISVLLFIIFIGQTYGQNNRNSNVEILEKDSLKCIIRVDKGSFDLGEPINVQFFIQNQSNDPVQLKLSDNPYFNFTFLIKSLKNQVVNENEEHYYDIVSESKKKINYKTITLDARQYYGQSFNLKKIFDLNQPGDYLIQGFFAPVPHNTRPTNNPIPSRIIQIEIRNSQFQEQVSLPEKEEMNDLNPYETVKSMLNARKKRMWDVYFSYIELESLIKQYPNYYERYNKLPPSKRGVIIEEFKEHLKSYMTKIGYRKFDSFEIYKTVIENRNKQARVFSEIIYIGDGITFKRKYTFYLRETNRGWFVYSYKVENI